MNWHKIKRRRTDILFSKYIRTRDGWKCTLTLPHSCFVPFKTENAPNLHCSHFWSRRNETTRFDPENCDSFCSMGHKYVESHRTEYEQWKEKQLGKKNYNLLMVRAHSVGKKDDVMAMLYIKELIKGLDS